VSEAQAGTGLDAPRKPRYGDELELVFARFDGKGRAVGTAGEFTVSARGGLVGSRARVKVLRRRRAEIEAHVLEVLERGPLAATPRCEYVPHCGGCSLQALDYAAQLAGLEADVRAAFDAQGLGAVPILPIVGARELYRYRNKMEFSFGTRRWIHPGEPAGAPDGFALGLHAAELYNKVIDIGRCWIQAEVADRVLASARALALEHGLEAWDLRTQRGLLRHLAMRAPRTGELLVNLVTSADAPERVGPYAAALVAREPAITTLVQNVNTRAAQVAIGEREHLLHGPGFVHEELCGVRFAISANSFFQTNSAQAEVLFGMLREEAALSGAERVFDLYCGTGALGLVLARSAGEVVGCEQVPAALADAERNLALNGFANVRFVLGDVLASLAQLASAGRPDVCVVDPPRAGLHPDVPARLAALGARRIVYVSCNPHSGARDAALLAGLGYRVLRVRPLDLFPHTPHVESVITLERGA